MNLFFFFFPIFQDLISSEGQQWLLVFYADKKRFPNPRSPFSYHTLASFKSSLAKGKMITFKTLFAFHLIYHFYEGIEKLLKIWIEPSQK